MILPQHVSTVSLPLIVFTDLDGTLLDHDSYSYEAAIPALSQLRTRTIPLILASSKTAAEIAPLRSELGFAHCPAIVENGAGILPAHAEPESLAGKTSDYAAIRSALAGVPDTFRPFFTGFGDWSEKEIAARTGLPADKAVLAGQRLFSEPGLWQGTEEQKAGFERCLAQKGISARQGGRYFTLSFGATKADRMREIVGQLVGKPGGALSFEGVPPVTMALGDAPNDIEMLQTADIGVIITNPCSTPLPMLEGEAEGRIKRSKNPGPRGWNDHVLAEVSRLCSADSPAQA